MKKKLLSIFLVSQFFIVLPSYSNQSDDLKRLTKQVEVYTNENKTPELVKTYEELIKLLPESVEYYVELGNIYSYKFNDKIKGLEYYNKALEFVKPDLKFSTVTNRKFLDELYKLSNNNQELHYQKVKEIVSTIKSYEKLYFAMATIYKDLKNQKEEESYLLKGIDLNSLNWAAYNNLGSLYKNQKKFDQSIKILEQGIKNVPKYGHILKLNLGIVYNDMNLTDKAIEVYKSNIESTPDFTSTYFNLAGLYLNQNKDKEAIEVLKKYLKIVPNDIDAISVIIVRQVKNKEFDNALEFINSNIDKRNIDLYHKLLGEVYKAKGDLKSANENFNISCKNGDEKACEMIIK